MNTAEILGRRYTSLVKIGEGAMGEVWKGTDPFLERDVALKLMRSELASRPDAVERFRNEAVSMARVNHPNIVPLYDFVQESGISWMVLEFVHGGTLEALLAQEGRLDWPRASQLVQQALRGLERAHAAGIVHRDIKPANAMIAQDGTLKLMDFGIARISQTTRLTRVGHAVGTVAYMAPEQILGQEADARADLYALGVVLFELVSGRLPFAGDTEAQIIRQHVDRTAAPRLRDVAAGTPAALDAVVAKALAREPARRYASAAEFRLALEALNAQAAAHGTAFRPVQGSVATRRVPRRVWSVGAALLSLGVVAALVWPRFGGKSAVSQEAQATLATEPSAVPPSAITAETPADTAASATEAQPGPSVLTQALRQCAELVDQAKAALAQGDAARTAELAQRARGVFSECEGAQEVLQGAARLAAKDKENEKEKERESAPAPEREAPRHAAPARETTTPREATAPREASPPAEAPRRASTTPAAAPTDDAVLSGHRLECAAAVNDGTRAYRRGDLEAARRLLQRAVTVDPSCPGADRLQQILAGS